MQYEWNDIAIIGDSFCSSRKWEHDWPQIVAMGLTGLEWDEDRQPRGRGISGSGFWRTRKLLHREVFSEADKVGGTVPKLLIICHTDSARINHDGDEPYNSATADSFPEVKSYYQYMFSPDFHKWCKIAWFRELKARWESKMKIVNLHCFDEFLHEDAVLPGLEYKTSLTQLVGKGALSGEQAGTSNHMTKEQNSNLGKALIDMINNNEVIQELDIVNGGYL